MNIEDSLFENKIKLESFVGDMNFLLKILEKSESMEINSIVKWIYTFNQKIMSLKARYIWLIQGIFRKIVNTNTLDRLLHHTSYERFISFF